MTPNADSGGRYLPSPTDLANERDPSKRLLALVEPATDLLVRATALDEANEIRAEAEAIERYARTIRLVPQAIGAAQTIARRAEVRIGELDQKRVNRFSPVASSGEDAIPRQQRHEFRQMAEAGPAVEEVLGELAPNGKATRAAVLRAVKRDRIEEASEPGRRFVDQSPVTEMMDAQRALRAAIKGLRRMQEYGQTFSAAPLARRVKDLCREMEDLL
jgi:hypothetical protein